MSATPTGWEGCSRAARESVTRRPISRPDRQGRGGHGCDEAGRCHGDEGVEADGSPQRDLAEERGDDRRGSEHRDRPGSELVNGARLSLQGPLRLVERDRDLRAKGIVDGHYSRPVAFAHLRTAGQCQTRPILRRVIGCGKSG
jgi:hypothetical protein